MVIGDGKGNKREGQDEKKEPQGNHRRRKSGNKWTSKSWEKWRRLKKEGAPELYTY